MKVGRRVSPIHQFELYPEAADLGDPLIAAEWKGRHHKDIKRGGGSIVAHSFSFFHSPSKAMKLALLLTILLATGIDFMQNMSTH